jgi:hypothetical protein
VMGSGKASLYMSSQYGHGTHVELTLKPSQPADGHSTSIGPGSPVVMIVKLVREAAVAVVVKAGP